jgi:hypothetical protein
MLFINRDYKHKTRLLAAVMECDLIVIGSLEEVVDIHLSWHVSRDMAFTNHSSMFKQGLNLEMYEPFLGLFMHT